MCGFVANAGGLAVRGDSEPLKLDGEQWDRGAIC